MGTSFCSPLERDVRVHSPAVTERHKTKFTSNLCGDAFERFQRRVLPVAGAPVPRNEVRMRENAVSAQMKPSLMVNRGKHVS